MTVGELDGGKCHNSSEISGSGDIMSNNTGLPNCCAATYKYKGLLAQLWDLRVISGILEGDKR
jgi:hypothetical protein